MHCLVFTHTANKKHDSQPPSRVKKIHEHKDIHDCQTPQQENIRPPEIVKLKYMYCWKVPTYKEPAAIAVYLMKTWSVKLFCTLEDGQLSWNMHAWNKAKRTSTKAVHRQDKYTKSQCCRMLCLSVKFCLIERNSVKKNTNSIIEQIKQTFEARHIWRLLFFPPLI